MLLVDDEWGKSQQRDRKSLMELPWEYVATGKANIMALIASSVLSIPSSLSLFFHPIKFPNTILLVGLNNQEKQRCKIQYSVIMMIEKESGVVVAARRSPMQASTEEELEGNTTTTTLRTAETFLRLLPIGLCVSALVLMLKNSQHNQYGSVSYTDLGAFKYLVHANGICAGYSLLSAIIVAVPRPPTVSRAWTFFFLDQVLTYIILAAGAASTEVLYLAENGNSASAWSSACGSFGRFCHKVTASLAITFVAVVCYVVLSLISSYKLFSKYDAPAIRPTTDVDVPALHG